MKDLIGKFQHAGSTMRNWYIHTQTGTKFETNAEYKKIKEFILPEVQKHHWNTYM